MSFGILRVLSAAAFSALPLSSLSAATYDLFFYDSPQVGNAASDNQSSGDRNFNEAILAATGILTIADSAISPNALIPLTDPSLVTLEINYTDLYGANLRWTLPGDPISTVGSNDPFVLLDGVGQFLRFELAVTTTAIPGIRIRDDEVPAPPPFGENGNPGIELNDRDDFDLGYVTQGFTAPNSIRQWIAGDYITASLWQELGSQGDFVRFAGTFSMEDSLRSNAGMKSGVILASLRQGDTDPEVGVVPLPAGLPLLVAGIGALGLLRRLRGRG